MRPNGVFMVMDLDPKSGAVQRLLNNPFASAAFKATEPWLTEYVSFNMEDNLKAAGFHQIATRYNTPSHKVVVAHKV